MDYINEKNIIEVQEVTVNTTEKAYEDAYEKLKHNKGEFLKHGLL